MTIQNLRCFVAVANTLNFAKAAERLCITQPAVTHQITALEQSLGVSLFDRSKRHVALTPAGAALLADAADILDHIALAEKHVQAIEFIDTLYIAYESTLQIRQLPQIYAGFHKRCPTVTINNSVVEANARNRYLTKEHMDVFFTSGRLDQEISGLKYRCLYKGYLCCVLPQSHPLAEKKVITPNDLENEVLILLDMRHCPPEMDEIQRELRLRCKNTRFCFSSASLYTIPMIQGGLGLAVMPDFVCPNTSGIVVRKFDLSASIEYGVSWWEKDHSEKTLAFIQTVREVLQNKW